MAFILPDIDENHLLRGGVRPRLFISYSRANLAQIGDIVKRLEGAYYDVWFDKRDIPGGEDWKRAIATGIQSAQRVLFFMSPESCASEYCQGEITHALKHGVHVIPVRINSKMDGSALASVGLTDRQYVDWSDEDSDRNWKRLLDDRGMIKPPLPREIRRLDPKFEQMHRRYLKTFFRPDFYQMSLADISDDSPVRGMPLTSVYVPLPVDFSITIQIDPKDKTTITDWWVKIEKSETRADENIPKELRERKLREWPALRVDEAGLRLLLTDAERKLIERAAEDTGDFQPEQNWYMEAHDAANVQSRMVLTGNPGSGKSTFLKHLALCLAGDMLKDQPDANIDALRFWTLPAYTPVFIRLVDIVKEQFPAADYASGVKPEVEHFERFIKTRLEKWNISAYWDDLQAQLDDSSAIILLDGLDEVPNAVEDWRREQIKHFVASLLAQYDKCRVIITSRPYAYNGDWRLNGFGQTTLKPLDWGRLYALAQALFAHLPEITEPRTEAKAFIKALGKNPRQDFWTNPLQFTMGAALWMRNRDKPVDERVPVSQSELYDKSVALMLEKWAKRDPTLGASVAELLHVTPEQLRAGLERLALQMQSDYGSDDRATFDWIELLKHLEECRREGKKKDERLPSIDYNLALDLLEQRAGLLTSEEGRVYRFQHLTYQEYLSACALAKPKHIPKTVVDKVLGQPGRWRNVVPLLWEMIEQRSFADLQALATALLPVDDSARVPADHALWELIAELARQQAKHAGVLTGEQKRALAQHLANLVNRGALAPVERAEAGRLLGDLGDPRPGVGVREDGLPDIVWSEEIPPGDYPIGGDDKVGRSLPAQTYTLSYSFRVSKYPITVAQFEAFVQAQDGINSPDHDWFEGIAADEADRMVMDAIFKETNGPRVNVNWYQAMAFCRWFSWRLTGKLFSLEDIAKWPARPPHEIEWEIAARGSDGLFYPYGNEYDVTKGNTAAIDIEQTCAVGMFPSGKSWCGAEDMSGNILEWCFSTAYGPQIIRFSSRQRALRGGSWNSLQLARAASRIVGLSNLRDGEYGFRVCRPTSL